MTTFPFSTEMVVGDWHSEDVPVGVPFDRWTDRAHGIELVSDELRETRERFDEWMRREERQ